MRGLGVQGPNPGLNLRPQAGGEAQEGIAALAVAEGNERQKETPTTSFWQPGQEPRGEKAGSARWGEWWRRHS